MKSRARLTGYGSLYTPPPPDVAEPLMPQLFRQQDPAHQPRGSSTNNSDDSLQVNGIVSPGSTVRCISSRHCSRYFSALVKSEQRFELTSELFESLAVASQGVMYVSQRAAANGWEPDHPEVGPPEELYRGGVTAVAIAEQHRAALTPCFDGFRGLQWANFVSGALLKLCCELITYLAPLNTGARRARRFVLLSRRCFFSALR
jgi:hypothetical protein